MGVVVRRRSGLAQIIQVSASEELTQGSILKLDARVRRRQACLDRSSNSVEHRVIDCSDAVCSLGLLTKKSSGAASRGQTVEGAHARAEHLLRFCLARSAPREVPFTTSLTSSPRLGPQTQRKESTTAMVIHMSRRVGEGAGL